MTRPTRARSPAVEHPANGIRVTYYYSACVGIATADVRRLAETDELFDNPLHPYTQALLEAVPIPDPTIEKARAHKVITGEIPSPMNPPPGCVFHPRCTIAVDECKKVAPEFREVKPGHWIACSQV